MSSTVRKSSNRLYSKIAGIMNWKLIYLLLLVESIYCQENTQCPRRQFSPCVCQNSPFAFLTCENIEDFEVLSTVFRKAKSTYFSTVRIRNSVLEYLPYNLFKDVQVTELLLYNVSLIQLFDEIPVHVESLKTLHLEHTYTFKDFLWEQLKLMTNLRILNIYYNKIRQLDEDFATYAPKRLINLYLYDTLTANIKPGVFEKFTLLEKLAIDHCKLKVLSRDMFPVPFNIIYLYFNENNLITIPEDLFTNMPKLKSISLRGNSISRLNFMRFDYDFSQITFFSLEDNPIHCNCNLKWLTSSKPKVLTGKCFTPPHLRDKKLDEIQANDLYCLSDN